MFSLTLPQHLWLSVDAEVDVQAAQIYSQCLLGNNKLEESCIHGDIRTKVGKCDCIWAQNSK